jgi:hypothetical protein
MEVSNKHRKRSVRGGVPILPSRGEVVTIDHVRRLRDEEGV